MNSEQPGQNKSDAGVTLETDVQFLRGVGPRKAAVFNKLGVKCAGDLLEYFPRSYEFRPPFTMMNELFPDHNVTVAGEIVQMRFNARSRPPRMDVTLEDPTGRCRLVWFHGGYLRDKFFPEDKIAAWGKIARYKDTLQITNPGWKEITDIDQVLQEQGHATPVY
ncbi:MAG: hypothetical protein K9M57_10005, partial [Phycisphaerae bacterium]|nr:hypothetical protein [Phycisphaerae bacterium]